jgi:hypothetical protein
MSVLLDHPDKLFAIQLRHPVAWLDLLPSPNARFESGELLRIFLDRVLFGAFKCITASVHIRAFYN